MPAFGKRRAFGQHFLRDPGIIRIIAQTAVEEASKNDCRGLLEIGPGKGAITYPLLELLDQQSWKTPHIERFTLAERDIKFVNDWHDRIDARKAETATPYEVKIQSGDFLELADEKWLTGTPLAVVSNLPYSAGTAILTRLAGHTKDIPVMVLMFQAEVAFRLRAESGTKAWGSLSIWIQNLWDVTQLCSVPPEAFTPPPDVDSEVVVLKRRTTPRVEVPNDAESQQLWESLLKACFAHRRKMLRSGLSAHPQFIQALQKAPIDPTLRAEALSWTQWAQFFSAVQSLR